MPLEARFFVKAGLVYLLLSFLVGALLLILEACGRPAPYVIEVEHAHLGMVGWLVNMVIGIALWMLPLNRERFPTTQGRYPATMVFACFGLLNGGLIARLVVEPWFALGGRSTALTILLVISALAQLAAIVVFTAIAWQRVRPPARPAPGVR